MYSKLIFLLFFHFPANARPIDNRIKRSVNLTREEQKYFSTIDTFCGHPQEKYHSLNMSIRLYPFIDPTNAAIASFCEFYIITMITWILVSLQHQSICVYFQCQCGATLAINFEFFDTGKKWTYGCDPSFTGELNVLQVDRGLVDFGQAFDSLPNDTYRLATNNCVTWTYDFYCKAVGQCVEIANVAVGYIWRTLAAPTVDLMRP
jgi:hypothetical protein